MLGRPAQRADSSGCKVHPLPGSFPATWSCFSPSLRVQQDPRRAPSASCRPPAPDKTPGPPDPRTKPPPPRPAPAPAPPAPLPVPGGTRGEGRPQPRRVRALPHLLHSAPLLATAAFPRSLPPAPPPARLCPPAPPGIRHVNRAGTAPSGTARLGTARHGSSPSPQPPAPGPTAPFSPRSSPEPRQPGGSRRGPPRGPVLPAWSPGFWGFGLGVMQP